MAQVALRKIVKMFDKTPAVQGIDLDIADREFIVLVGPSGCGKSTTSADGRRARRSHLGRDLYRRPARQRRAAEGPRHRDGVPELRALPAYDRVREHVVRAAAAEVPEGRDQGAGRERGPHPRHHPPARPPAEAALGRTAAARRDGPRDRAQSQGVPVRRAAVEPRRQTARADAHRDQEGAPEGHDDDDLRDARPGRGDDPGRPRRRHECRAHRADRHAVRGLPPAGDPLRRRLHRLAGDEFPALPAGAERQRADACALSDKLAFPVPGTPRPRAIGRMSAAN